MIISNLPNYKKIVLVIILLIIIFSELIWYYVNEYFDLNLNNKSTNDNENTNTNKNKIKEEFSIINTNSVSNIFKNNNINNNNNNNNNNIFNLDEYKFLPNFFEKNLTKSNFLKSTMNTIMTPEEYFKIENRSLNANNSKYIS